MPRVAGKGTHIAGRHVQEMAISLRAIRHATGELPGVPLDQVDNQRLARLPQQVRGHQRPAATSTDDGNFSGKGLDHGV